MSQRYALINREEGGYPIVSMSPVGEGCRGRDTCSWRVRRQSRRDVGRRELAAMIETELRASNGTDGYRRITAGLGLRGMSASGDTVRGLMRQAGLVAACPRRRTRTTIPEVALGSWPDLVGA